MLNFVVLLSLLAFTKSKLVPPPVYTLNFSLPASEVWAEVAKDFAPKFPSLFKDIESKLPEELLKEVSAITPDLDKYFFPQFVEEMKGIAKYGNVSLERIVLLNLLYDIHAYDQREEIPSISVVLNSNQDVGNPIISGQTIAWAYSPLLRDMVINIDPRVKQYDFQGTTFAGMVGFLSGLTVGDFSAAYAERKSNPNETWKIIFNCLRSGENYTTLSFQVRHKLQYDDLGSDFVAAVMEFSTSRLVAPNYLMLGGWDAGQGVLITRDRYAAYDKVFLLSNQTDWYVVGTNKMPWAQPPDPQKKLLMSELEKAGNNDMDVPNLIKILEHPQLYNNHTAFVVATTPCYWGPYTSLVYYPD